MTSFGYTLSSSPNAFDGFISRVDHPMLLVTTVAGDVHAGCLVGFHADTKGPVAFDNQTA